MKGKLSLYFIYLRLKFFYIFSTLFISMHDLRNMNIYLSEIKLVIKGPGESFFINNNFNPSPSEVIINVDIKYSGIKSYDFTEDLNYVVIKFDEQITSCERMFEQLNNIIEIDLSNFDASQVVNMSSMFFNCNKLKKIYLGNMDTSLVQNMDFLFNKCEKLTSIDVSNFVTSSVTTMHQMFGNCEALTSIDVSNFDTKNVEDMYEMFGYCKELITVNVSNFNTAKVKDMQGMFFLCGKLKYLDLSSFVTSSINNIIYLFAGCDSLVYIKLNSFTFKEGDYLNSMFEWISQKKICINDGSSIRLLNLTYPNMIYNCSDKCFENDIKINLQNDDCINNCNESECKYELNKLCYRICPDSSYLSSYNEYLCLDKSSEGNYYYDNIKRLYKECYNTCKRCNKGGNETNHNCMECNDNNPIKLRLNNYYNCFLNCTYYYYFDNDNNYHCTDNTSCPDEYPLLDKLECKISNEKKLEELIKNLNNETNKEEEIPYYNKILKIVEDIFTSEDYVTTKLDNGNNEIIEINKLKITFTTTQNQNNNKIVI